MSYHHLLRRGVLLPALIGVLAFAGNAAVFVAATYPQHRERSRALEAHAAAAGRLHSVRQQMRSLRVLGGDALRARQDLQVLLEQRLDPMSRLPEALAFMRTAAADAGIVLENIDYSVEPVEALDALSLGMSARGAGSYGAIRQWIVALRQGPGLMFVDSVEIAGTGTVLSVQLTAVAMLHVTEATRP